MTDLPDKFSELRRRAEELAQQAEPTTLSLADARQMIHELQVHQIELEIQNEELRMTQQNLENARRKYLDLYEFSPVGLFTLDAYGHIVEANITLSKMLNLQRSELITHPFSDFIEPAMQDTYHIFFQALRAGVSGQSCEIAFGHEQDMLFMRLDGITQPGPTYCIAVGNMTAQKQAEQQKLELSLHRQRVKLLADFIHNTSHDLRTPITSIMTGLYLVGHTSNREVQLEKIAVINEQLLQFTRTLEQLQQMAVLDSTPALELQPYQLHRLLREVVDSLEPLFREKNLYLSYHLQEDLPDAAVNPIQMHQVFLNLLGNAIKFTPAGGSIDIVTRHTENSIVLEITDNGIGIDVQALPHIFEHFFKADQARSNAGGGVGLGLSMAQRIIELHHGKIEVESIPHEKTTVRICLPLHKT